MSVSMLADESITITTSGLLATEVILDDRVRTVAVEGYDPTGTVPTAAFFATVGTDGGAIDPTRKTIDAGALYQYPVATRARVLAGTSVFVSSSQAGGKVEVVTSRVSVS